jgi:hypothetical protein
MTRALLACAAVCLTTIAVYAADPKVDAAINTFKQTEGDAAKLKTYCAMSDVVEAQGDKEDAAADAKTDDFLKQLGPDFEAAWDTADEADENSPDGKRLSAALDELDAKCPE